MCLMAYTADDGRRLVPYATRPVERTWSMDASHSGDVTRYTAEAKNRFTAGASDLEHLKKLHTAALHDQWKIALQVLAAGLAIGWVLMAATGWIVRGFLGIPRGKDARSAI